MLIPFKVPQHPARHACSRLARPVAVAAISLCAMLGGLTAHAAQEHVDEVSKLLEQGKAAQAAKQAETYLKQNPADVQMRFLQGVIAAEQKQNAQAIKIFTALTREYPNLPEPYNNLAVLYAAEGQERKASEVLEQAIRTNPSYATAHENLGDLYARMASEAYAKALQLDGSRQAIQPKLALITQIFPKQGGAQAKVAVAQNARDDRAAAAAKADQTKAAEARAAEAKAAEAKAAEFKAAEVKAADAKAAEAKAAQAKAAEAAKVAQAKPVDAKPADAKPTAPAPAVVAQAAPPAAEEKKVADKPAKSPAIDEVESAVKAWASAWAGQDINRYLDSYSEHFSPADGSSIAKWKEQRHQRIVGRASIVVSLRDLKVSVDGDKATAQFRQYYASGALKTTTRKTLRLQREKGQWRITHEGTGA